jgi:AraC family transcriptional regulator
MLKPYDLLERVLLEIENNIRDGVNADLLAGSFSLSSIHLQRLFKFAFNRSIGSYIRSRRLAASLDDLLKTNFNVLNIAIEYGFEYEETYIRAFKREYGMTPGDIRKTGAIVKVTPPLNLFEAKKADNGVFFGPEIVMVPQFFVVGKFYQLLSDDLAALTPNMVREFWYCEHMKIKNAVHPEILYTGIGFNYNFGEGNAEYLASVPVTDLSNIPEGLSSYTFEASLCARFRYIGQHHYTELNREIMQPMYDEVKKFRTNEKEKYALLNDKIYVEKLDTRHYDGTYCQMEWFAPVAEKNQNDEKRQ